MRMVKGSYQYKESGLDDVYLVNGFEYIDTPEGRSVIIHDIDGLHEAIGRILVNDRKVLSGSEIRFLRHEVGMSQSTLAKLLDVNEQTVRRWEQDKQELPRAADAIIRGIYKEKVVGEDSRIASILARIAELEDAIDRRELVLEENNDAWGRKDAA